MPNYIGLLCDLEPSAGYLDVNSLKCAACAATQTACDAEQFNGVICQSLLPECRIHCGAQRQAVQAALVAECGSATTDQVGLESVFEVRSDQVGPTTESAEEMATKENEAKADLAEMTSKEIQVKSHHESNVTAVTALRTKENELQQKLTNCTSEGSGCTSQLQNATSQLQTATSQLQNATSQLEACQREDKPLLHLTVPTF